MENDKKNQIILEAIKKQILGLSQIQIEDDKIIFQNQSIDIKDFDLSILLDEKFVQSLVNLKPEEIFEAFKKKIEEYKSKSNEEKWQVVVEENPVMNCVTIFEKMDEDLGKKIEFINIYTSDGKNHLFRNDPKMDIFAEYNKIKKEYGSDITPEVFVNEIEKWKKTNLDVNKSDDSLKNEGVKESFKTKLREITDKYIDKEYIEVEANEEEEIIFVNNKLDPEKNIIITFDKDMNGELVMNVHKNNVAEITTSKKDVNSEDGNTKDSSVESVIDSNNDDIQNMKYDNYEDVISEEHFFDLLNVDSPYSSTERIEVDNFYRHIEERIQQKDSSVEELMTRYGNNVETIQLADDINERQQEAIDKFYELQEKLNMIKGISKGEALVLRPNQIKTDIIDNDDNSGYSVNISIILGTAIAVVLLGIITLIIVTK